MKKIYFLRKQEKLFSVCRDFFEKFYLKDNPLFIKFSFGHASNKFALKVDDIKPVIEAALISGLKPVLVDTPRAYLRISFYNLAPAAYNLAPTAILDFFSRKIYERITRKGDFTRSAPTIISNRFTKKVESRDHNIEICREFVEAKNVLVISHIKGHRYCGFGGAIKNLAMGMTSPKTKAEAHIFAKPKIIDNCCQSCGKCVRLCPENSISLSKNRLKINLRKCGGCSICQIECPRQCLVPRKAIFDESLAQTAIKVFKNLPKRTLFINFATNIAKECDCLPISTKLISENVGYFFADCPVLIDKASIDLINKLNGKNLFFEENHKDPYLQINFALKYGRINGSYELIIL